MALAELGWHLGVMGDDRLPDIPGLKAASERLVDRQAAELGVDDVARIGIRVAEVFRETKAQFSYSHCHWL